MIRFSLFFMRFSSGLYLRVISNIQFSEGYFYLWDNPFFVCRDTATKRTSKKNFLSDLLMDYSYSIGFSDSALLTTIFYLFHFFYHVLFLLYYCRTCI